MARDVRDDRPTVVQVTIVPGPRDRGVLARLGDAGELVAWWRIGLFGVLVAIIVAGVFAGLQFGGAGPAAGGGRPAIGGPRPVAGSEAAAYSAPSLQASATLLKALRAAYRYPLGCLSISVSGVPARHGATRAGPCWRYGVYVTAILREVNGVWRLALAATSRACPRVALPPSLRDQVVVCRR